MKRTVLFLVGVLVPASSAALTQTAADFHAPRSEAERALDTILKRADADKYQLDNLFDGRGDDSFRRKFDYSTVLTPALLSALKEAEAAMVRKECGGAYSPGDICGFDYTPITCGQDFQYPYLYRTDSAGRDEALLSYAWSDKKRTATYRLVKQRNRWKIDSVACAESGVTFHAN